MRRLVVVLFIVGIPLLIAYTDYYWERYHPSESPNGMEKRLRSYIIEAFVMIIPLFFILRWFT